MTTKKIIKLIMKPWEKKKEKRILLFSSMRSLTVPNPEVCMGTWLDSYSSH